MEFTPLLDRVLVLPTPVEEKTLGGIIMSAVSETTKAAATTTGTVIKAGPGRTENGIPIPMTVREGDKVMWSKFAGSILEIEEEKYLLMRETDLVAITKIAPRPVCMESQV